MKSIIDVLNQEYQEHLDAGGTHETYIAPELAAKLGALRADLEAVAVALEGMAAELHDGITPLIHRGKPGTFDVCTVRIAAAHKALARPGVRKVLEEKDV